MRSGAKSCAIPARPLIRIFLGIALAALAAALAPVQAQTPSQHLPSFAELQAVGARIGRIHVAPARAAFTLSVGVALSL